MTRARRITARYPVLALTRGSCSGATSSLAVASRIVPSLCRLPSVSTYPRGSVNGNSVRSLDTFQTFVRDLQRIDRHLIGRRVEPRAGPLGRPAVGKCPLGRFFAFVVEKDDLAVLARILDLAVDDHGPPLPEILVLSDAALQRDVGEFLQAGELAKPGRLVAVTIVDRVGSGIEPGHFAEPRFGDAVDLHFEPEPAVGVGWARTNSHARISSLG